MVADITIGVGNTPSKIIITDASTAGYGGETITSRVVLITDSTGSVITLPFPLIVGVGDSVVYDLVVPKAITVQLLLTPSVVNPSSNYSKTYSYALLSVFDAYLKSLEDNIVYNIDPTSVLSASTTLIREFEWSKTLYEYASLYSSLGEVTPAQKCIDCLIQLSKPR